MSLPVDGVTLLAFVPAALALNFTPGADMMFCLGQGLRGGARPAALASAGISAGSMIHAALAGLGLGAVVAAHPVAFDAIRWAGVCYLLWLAWGALRHGSAPEGDAAPRPRPAHAFRDGLAVNLSNPKVILFVLAFIPQFIDPARGAVLAQFLIFGGIIALGGFFINAGVGAFAGGAGRLLAGSPGAGRWLGRISAGIFGALALRLALSERS
ncbi:LysE family translocator [Maritimibacter sp. 55A14]|uniref:LysE family translocator n=1 Tax=Maritimibacter sp. 55A14 TaxID=2174844 RepID=UPI000D60FF7A|nr:LysE family translocator [Maritimibacter sp. 55A14]PWE32304.1 LysE family translocator [Maritimibacter sp. 55A14]